jgi:hypothetical protein
LCVHFANAGRCTRAQCPFPHVRTGARDGVCRDFAVLGYCEEGLDCEKQHVRECPDFAERGACSTKGCKLPHVIRANRNRHKTGTNAPSASANVATVSVAPPTSSSSFKSTDTDSSEALQASAQVSAAVTTTAEDAQLGDEFISLTFREESSEDENENEEDEDDDDEDSEGDDDETQDEEEAASPTEDHNNMETNVD